MPPADLLTRPSAPVPAAEAPAPQASFPPSRTPSPRRLLAAVAAAALLALAVLTVLALTRPHPGTQQLAAAARAATQAERLMHAGPLLQSGDATGTAALRAAQQSLAQTVPELPAVAQPAARRIQQHGARLLELQPALAEAGAAVRSLQLQAAALQQASEAVTAAKLQQGAPAAEAAAATQLGMLAQRIARQSAAMAGAPPGGDGAQARAALARDVDTFGVLLQGLRENGVQAPLQTLRERWTAMRTQAETVLARAEALAAADDTQAALAVDADALRQALAPRFEAQASAQAALSPGLAVALAVAALVALLAGIALARSLLRESRERHALAERQRREAEQQQLQARRVNDGNQAAILRLMDELQTVAEGDLTRQATVTEDITGAIADSINYTVEELRALVTSVQNTATRVAQTTAQVDSTSTELLAASTEQLREIRETGRSVLDMASRINTVSQQAQESAQVARQSRQAAESGLTAVQNAIGGMNAIRDQIQETSKRIKRLGESSQEIGEITELISDITEQTNVLALNAAIQAASAGEAGRGFSVVAEEVQRLAERSGDATRQIAALVKAIQTDTQDTVAAMERSTQGVVAGTQLSDTAGTALSEIDRVSRHLARLIEQISEASSQEAELANEVAENIQHIFAVTEQTGDGTRATARQVRELAGTAEELRQSVARFKL